MKKTAMLFICAAMFSGCIKFRTPAYELEIDIPMEQQGE